MVERVIADFGAAHALKAIVLRYFNAAGADPDNEIGECADPELIWFPCCSMPLPVVEDNVTVFGLDYPTHDGTCVRDYVHVSDLAEAHVKALRAPIGRRSVFDLQSRRWLDSRSRK